MHKLTLANEVYIVGRRISDADPVFIIGEMACGHQGDVKQARALVDATVIAGADAIQFEIFEPVANMVPTSKLYAVLEELYFSANEWRELVSHARKQKIAVSIFAYDEPSLELAISLKPDMLKLNSSELANPPMIIGAAESGLPFTVGTGASTLNEIKCAVELSLKHGGNQMILMHGVQNFPTPVDQSNIKKIKRLKDEFDGLVIYADHTDADIPVSRWNDLLAIGMGANMLEKHLVMDRKQKGVDWQAALEPQEFKSYVEAMRLGWKALGSYDFQEFSEGEIKYRRFQKKSMVAAREIKTGEIIKLEAVSFLRVQGELEGIAPIDFPAKAEGKRVNRLINKFEQILPQDLEV